MSEDANVDRRVVEGFGKEWEAYDQSRFNGSEMQASFHGYFSMFPFSELSSDSVGFDMGCGSGRWAASVAPRVGKLTCVDPSQLALAQAERRMIGYRNVAFECAAVSDTKIPPGSQDFGYSLGVLHHVPNTLEGIRSCGRLLKSGAPFLLYLYYNFENRPIWFRLLWKASDFVRKLISELPFGLKLAVTRGFAVLVYWPLARLSKLLASLGLRVENIPLSYYKDKSLYTMMTDSLDRFGTTLERRFSKAEIVEMLENSGFVEVQFSSGSPFWVAVARKA